MSKEEFDLARRTGQASAKLTMAIIEINVLIEHHLDFNIEKDAETIKRLLKIKEELLNAQKDLMG